MHVAGNKEVIKLKYKDFFKPYIYQKPANALVIDVGCGPMTACVALADLQQSFPAKKRIDLDYVGCDIQPYMTDIALKFADKESQNDLFGENFRGCYPDIKNTDWIEQVDCSVKDGGTLVFYFSYFWGQQGVSEEVGKWVDCVKRISLQARAEDTFIVYLNKDMDGYNGAYIGFKHRLSIRPDTLKTLERDQCNYNFRVWRGMEKWLTDDKLPTSWSKQSEHLHYEILRVDWRHYEDAGTDRNLSV